MSTLTTSPCFACKLSTRSQPPNHQHTVSDALATRLRLATPQMQRFVSMSHAWETVCCEAHAISFGGLDALRPLRDAIVTASVSARETTSNRKRWTISNIEAQPKTTVYDRAGRAIAK